MSLCREQFDGQQQRDNKLLLNYLQRSTVWQSNIHQLIIYDVAADAGQFEVIVIRPDLYLKVDSDGVSKSEDENELFLVAIPNDHHPDGMKRRMEWKAHWVMTGQQICEWLKMNGSAFNLPRSPRRSMTSFEGQIQRISKGLSFEEVNSSILDRRKALKRGKCRRNRCGCKRFEAVLNGSECRICGHTAQCHEWQGLLVIKQPIQIRRCRERGCDCLRLNRHSQRNGVCSKCGHKAQSHGNLPVIQITPNLVAPNQMTPEQFKSAVERSWNESAACPVAMNKGKKTVIQWKKFVDLGGGHKVAISLVMNEHSKKWKIIKVIDCNAHQVFFGHRLLAELRPKDMRWTYQALDTIINAELELL